MEEHIRCCREYKFVSKQRQGYQVMSCGQLWLFSDGVYDVPSGTVQLGDEELLELLDGIKQKDDLFSRCREFYRKYSRNGQHAEHPVSSGVSRAAARIMRKKFY